MLSEESAIGDDPINVVDTMSNIITQTEYIYDFQKQEKLECSDDFDVIQSSVTKLADSLGAAGILALTSSGKSAIKMSRFRPRVPILAFAHKKKTLSALTTAWGVTPIETIKEAQASKMIQKMLKALEHRDLLDLKGPYITTIGYPVGVPGSTNTIKILNEDEINYYLNLKEQKKKFNL